MGCKLANKKALLAMFEFNPQILDQVYLLASLGCQHNSTNWPRLRIKEKTSLLQKLLCTGSSNWSFQLSVILWARNPFEISSSLHWTLPMQIHTQLDPMHRVFLVFGILTSFWLFLLIEHCIWIMDRQISCKKRAPAPRIGRLSMKDKDTLLRFPLH